MKTIPVNTLKEAINQSFGTLSDQELTVLLSYFQEIEIPVNGYFLKEAQYCQYLSFQQSGVLRIYKSIEAKEITQWLAPPNYFITELASFFFNQPSRWNIQALTDVKLLSLSKTNYIKVAKEFPKWQEIERNFIAKCFETLENRVFSHLSMSAEERYDAYFIQNKELFNQVPLHYIASVLGMTAETFSRIRKRKNESS